MEVCVCNLFGFSQCPYLQQLSALTLKALHYVNVLGKPDMLKQSTSHMFDYIFCLATGISPSKCNFKFDFKNSTRKLSYV